MKEIFNIISISVLIIFSGCKSENPTFRSLIGVWNANDGALIKLLNDGTFFTEELSGNKIFPYEKDFKNKFFNETGKWELSYDQGTWIVFLYFSKSEKLPKGYSTQILIAGSNGILENKPPWYLFLWEGEEGGERYKFTKKEN